MAEKRMFSNKVIGSDDFLEMPATTQNLYFHLSMQADDDGFIDKHKSIMRMIGAKEDDLKVLIAKCFVIAFNSGVIVIRHWRVNNYLQNDRVKPTMHTDEFEQLAIEKNKMYTKCIHSIDKISIDKVSIEENSPPPKLKNFVVPSIEEIRQYCQERKNNINAENFFNFYQSKGWLVGKVKMKDWKACVRTWEQRDGGNKNSNNPHQDINADDLNKKLRNISVEDL